MIVDDNQTNLAILACQVQGWGATPYLVNSGAQALETLASLDQHGVFIDLTLLDMNMPGMDGKRWHSRFDRTRVLTKCD